MVTLVLQTPEERTVWLPRMIEEYVEQRIGAGEPPETARASGTAQFEQLFPGGEPAEGQFVMAVVDDDEVVGTLWMGRPFNNDEGTWYVFYVEVDASKRGRGLGRATMEAAEAWTVEHGGSRIALNVFGPNTVARSLYDSLGFQVMATAMYKDLSASA